ncbi:hypothetical protein AYX13_06994 [Cryptococcus neoformans]|nr:hypothetical protein AYX13_06994 [Cryptococcus neoformans var. grubii]
MFSQNPARSIQDRPDENAVSPIDDIWDKATPDDSFGSDTEDSDEEGEDLAARDTHSATGKDKRAKVELLVTKGSMLSCFVQPGRVTVE